MKHLSWVLRAGTACTALALLGAGCGASTQVNAPGAVPVPVASSGSCDHPYFPLKPGYAIDYKVDADGRNMTYAMKVASATPNGAKLEVTMDYEGVHVLTQDLGCGPDGSILAGTYLDMTSAFTKGQITSQTKSAHGMLMPKNLSVGATWTDSYENLVTVKGMQLPPGMDKMTAAIEESNTVTGEEQVTVPAGTFTTKKVKTETVNTVKLGNTGIPQITKSTSYAWYAKGVGMVKMVDEQGKTTSVAVKITRP